MLPRSQIAVSWNATPPAGGTGTAAEEDAGAAPVLRVPQAAGEAMPGDAPGDELPALEADRAWFRDIVAGACDRREEIDGLINRALEGRREVARMEITLRAILRAGVYELLARIDTPILILTGNADIDNKVRGLGFGADDYMTKPFHKDELIARIHAVVRRSKGHSQSVINTGKLTVNLDTKTVEVEGNRVHLTGKEYQMFELLSLRKGTTLTKEMFLNHLYGGMDEPELKIIDVFICKLRKKLQQATGGNHYIETVWGRGYVLRDPRPSSKTSEVEEAA